MRQLGDFASWLGLILIVFGVIYYTPKLVDYINDDSPARAKTTFTPRHARGGAASRRNMAMYHHLGLDRPAPEALREGGTP
jgi:hypothetical protein